MPSDLQKRLRKLGIQKGARHITPKPKPKRRTGIESLIDGEITEPADPADSAMPGMGMNSADPEGEQREDLHDEEPEASERTTPPDPGTEPEPPEATTRSSTSRFWFVPDPALKGAK